MKRPVILTFAIIFSIAAIAVLCVLVASLSGRMDMMGFLSKGFSNATSGELIKEESFDAAGLTNFYVKARDQRIDFIMTDGDEITVRQYDTKDAEPFEAQKTTDNLSIELKADIRLVLFGISMPRLEIYIPRGYAGSISASSSSGSIVCEEAVRWADTELEAKSGSIRFNQGITCDSLSAVSGSGTIKISEIQAAGNVLLSAASGSIRVEGDIECTSFTAEAGSGMVALDDVEIYGNGTAKITTHSGGIRMNKLTSLSGFYITAGSGSVKAEAMTGLGFVNSGSGSVSCGELSVTGDTEITCGSGAVRVSLDDVRNLNIETITGSGSLRASDYSFMFDASGRRGYCTIGDGSIGTLSIKTGSGSIVID